MKLGLVGASYQERSLPFDAQRTVNLYPVVDESRQGKEVAALYGTAGLKVFVEIPDSPIRAEFYSAKQKRAFAVAGEGLYEVFANGTYLLLGTLDSNESVCTVAENVTQLAVCDGNDLYILTYATNTLVKVDDPSFPQASSVVFVDQYFVVSKPDSAEFYISTLADGTGWASLDFATAESSPDDLVRVFASFGQLFLMGENTTEIWYNSGNVDFPFARVEGAKMQVGLAARDSAVEIDNSLFWVGSDKDGDSIIYRANGYNEQRVSTHAIEEILGKIDDISAIRGYSYQENGHSFYVITGGGLPTSLAYDASTQMWHEKAYTNSKGDFEVHRAASHIFAFGKNLVGDYSNGKIYEQSLDFYDDDGDEIRRERTFTHISSENNRFTVNEVQIDFESGVGLTNGQGSDPQVWLQTSNNGARSFGTELLAGIGKLGKLRTRAVWRRLGQFDLMTLKVSISDPVKVAICGAYMK